MNRDARFLESIRLDRRGLFVLAAAALTSACGGNGGGASSSPTTTETATTATDIAGAVDELTGVPAKVPRIDDAAVTTFQKTFGADWLGAWADDSGGTGTFDAAIGIDLPRRLASVDVTFDGPVLGSGPPVAARHTISVDEAHSRDSYRFVSSQIGELEVQPLGNYSADFTLLSIPGYIAIDKVESSVSGYARQGYLTVYQRDGSVRTVSIGFEQGTRPPAPDPGDVVRLQVTTGVYACRFLNDAVASRIVGEPVVVFRNGGALNDEPGIDISNCWFVRPKDIVSSGVVKGAMIDYSVYLAADPSRAKAYFNAVRKRTAAATKRVVAGPELGDDSFQLDAVDPVEVWILVGSRLLQVKRPVLLYDDPSRGTAVVLATAKAVVPRLRSA